MQILANSCVLTEINGFGDEIDWNYITGAG